MDTTPLPRPPPPVPSTAPDASFFVQQFMAMLPLPDALASSQHTFAVILSIIASMGTFVGGIVVIGLVKFAKTDTRSRNAARLMGVLQAFSGGVMLHMVFADLLPESTEQLGSRQTLAWFFCGIVSFLSLEHWIIPKHEDEEDMMFEEQPTDRDQQEVAGTPPEGTTSAASDSRQGGKSAGVLVEHGVRKRTAATTSRENRPVTSDHTVDGLPNLNSAKGRRDLWRTSVITFTAMALHNLPEGLGVYLSTLADAKLGLQLAVAVMLHNIPEGMAVAIPLYVATDGHTSHVLWMTLANGLAEPAGVVIGGYLLRNFLTPAVLSRCLAAVAGIMASISLHELQPTAIKYCGKNMASLALFFGMFVCWVAMEGVTELMGGHSK